MNNPIESIGFMVLGFVIGIHLATWMKSATIKKLWMLIDLQRAVILAHREHAEFNTPSDVCRCGWLGEYQH